MLLAPTIYKSRADIQRGREAWQPFKKLVIFESREIGLAGMKNQSVAEAVFAGIFESLPAP